jgi:hypothetical protein
MFKQASTFFILCFTLFCFYTAEALTEQQSGRILDAFKNRQQELLFEDNI